MQKVRLIFKTHLDVGFTDTAENVRKKYFSCFIRNAVKTAEYFRQQNGSFRYVWTVGSWLIREFLERAGEDDRKMLCDAVRRGDITWHALPFTMHSELADDAFFRRSLAISQELDKQFGHRTVSAKMTDVPGHTRGIIAPLADAGIKFLHIGINAASALPDVPPIFRWRDSHDREILVAYHGEYGSGILCGDTLFQIEMTGDNFGPHTPEQVKKILARYPDCDVQSSTLDELAEALISRRDAYPLVTGEIGDTWIHGIGTDPWKTVRFRELERFYPSCGNFPRKADFERAMLEVAEHTWGKDEKIHYHELYSWDDNDWKLRRSDAKRFAASWTEQRKLLKTAVACLPEEKQKEAQKRLSALTPRKSRMRKKETPVLENEFFALSLNPAKGCLKSLIVKGTELEFQNFGLFTHEIFTRRDYNRFRKQYLRTPDEAWAIHDFTKPDMGKYPKITVSGFRSEIYSGGNRILFVSKKPSTIEHLETEYVLNGSQLEMTFRWFGKPDSRKPQAIWNSFRQNGSQKVLLRKMSEWIDPKDVVSNGARTLHAVQEVRFGNTTSLISPDAILLAPGRRSMLDFHNQLPEESDGVHFNLYNNIWGTNFPMWFHDDMQFRFILKAL